MENIFKYSLFFLTLLLAVISWPNITQCVTLCSNDIPISERGDCPAVLSIGEKCDPVVDTCNQDKFQTCDPGSSTCQCKIEPEYSAWYDPNTDMCYRKANSTCTLTPESQKCELNSKCLPANSNNDQHKCTCNEGLVPNRDGLCFQQYEGACSPEKDLCDPAGFLICNLESKCKCDHNQIFHAETQTCQILTGGLCELNTSFSHPNCVYNASCLEIGPEINKCRCDDGFTSTELGTCALPHGAECDPDFDQCDGTIPGLECNRDDGKCLCQDKENSFYDESTKTCYLLADAPCNLEEYADRKCIPNSKCTFPGICTCTDPLEQNRERHCALIHGSTCDPRNDLCDQAAYLYCNPNSTCTCEKGNTTFYDSNTNTCRLIAEAECSLDEGSQSCVENSKCKPRADDVHKCMCSDGFVGNKKGRCFLRFEQICNMDGTDMCDPDGFTSCFDSKCQCIFPGTKYSHSSQDCRRLPGGTCFQSQTEPECTQNASCDAETKTCVCKRGHEESTDGACLLGYKQSCGENSGICNDGNFLECVDNICQCSAGYFPDVGLDTTIEYGVRCQATYGYACSQNVSCHTASQLGCSNGFCGCLQPDSQIYDPEMERCVGLVGANCTTGNSSTYTILCNSNLKCVSNENDTDESYGTCECKNTYENLLLEECNNANTVYTTSIGLLFLVPVAVWIREMNY